MAFIRLCSNDLMSFMFPVCVWVLLQIKCHACYTFEFICISLLVFHKFLEKVGVLHQNLFPLFIIQMSVMDLSITVSHKH